MPRSSERRSAAPSPLAVSPRPRWPGLSLPGLPLLGLVLVSGASFGQPAGEGQAPDSRDGPGLEQESADAPAAEYSSPYAAWDAGSYEQALRGFADRQTKRPDDPELSLNVGAAHYRLNDFEAADSQFYQSAASGEDELRAQALYNLGNSAYRQGKLEDAVDFYMASLEANPDDIDAKFNLEFVRREMERQEQQRQDGEGQEQQDQPDEQDEEQQDQDRNQQEQPSEQDGEAGEEEQDQQPQGGESPRDSDGDGLSDDLERNAENPTDPGNPDSDSDGLPDGQEDRNRNGRVDAGETDPNRSDTDGDGVPDARDATPQGDDPQDGGPSDPSAAPPPGMTQEEAERYLQALEEGRPDPARRAQRGRRSRLAKDW